MKMHSFALGTMQLFKTKEKVQSEERLQELLRLDWEWHKRIERQLKDQSEKRLHELLRFGWGYQKRIQTTLAGLTPTLHCLLQTVHVPSEQRGCFQRLNKEGAMVLV